MMRLGFAGLALAAAMGVTRAFWMHCISTLLIFLILVDMIWKPGA